MIALPTFLRGIEDNAARVRVYKKPGDGENGECDCIGLIIGGKRLAGGKWTGKHGSNYAFRNEMQDVKQISSVNDLFIGEIVYKAREPGDQYYDLPDGYKPGCKNYNGDLRDYYHVGVVTDISPLEITHCTSPGPIERDKKLGKWKYGGRLKDIDYGSIVTPGADIGGKNMSDTHVEVGYVYGGNVDSPINMRERPSKSSGIVTKIPQREMVEILARNDQWVKVKYNSHLGYVMKEFVIESMDDGPTDDLNPTNPAIEALEKRIIDLEQRVYALEHQVGFG